MLFDSTVGFSGRPHHGSLSEASLFPSIAELSSPELSSVDSRRIDRQDDTRAACAQVRPEDGIVDELDRACQFALFAYQIDSKKLWKAKLEASILARSGIFSEKTRPLISIDPYCEITFSHSSMKGYVDIGVRGDGEISYHVRNDVEPDSTRYEDADWRSYRMPDDLIFALSALEQALEG